MNAETQAAASRLCRMCGMCCNGALFQSVALQPGDSEDEVTAAGLRLERHKDVVYFRQPCAALKGCHCTVYEKRPARCREFACKQIQMLAAGETTEPEARATIEAAADLFNQMSDLLLQSSDTNTDRPLVTRYNQAIKKPVDLDGVKIRARLMIAAEAFAEMLEERFRN